MESAAAATAEPATTVGEKESMVDPFLLEALQNPRHRLTILRMELDIQRFLQSSDQQQFEFQHFPTSYLRLAAHRVAQHYGLITTVQDSGLDGNGNRILVRRTAESRYPAVRLSEIPAKKSESGNLEYMKISIKARPCKGIASEANEMGKRQSPVRSVDERKEEYDRARARIFNSPNSPESDDSSFQGSLIEKNTNQIRDENQVYKSTFIEAERSVVLREGGTSSRVAILRDREKDRFDPDYDRSYERYVRSLRVNQTFGLPNLQNVQPPFYNTGFPPFGQIPTAIASLSYRPDASSVMGPYGAMGLNQTSRDAVYMQWPNAAMIYAHSYEQFRHAAHQAQIHQQPLSFDYSQNR